MSEELRTYLNSFAKSVVKQSRTNLTRNKRNASKSLYNSIGYDLDVHKNSFSLSFEMEDYGKFIDKGVKGKKKGKSLEGFRYTNKRPPAKAFDKWAVRKGLAGRDKKGKFTSRKSLQFALATHIYNNGIKPSLFFTKPFEQAFKRLPDEVIEKFGLDLDELLKEALNIK